MNVYNWGSFSARINIHAAIHAVYELWSTGAGMERWFLRQCEIRNEQGEMKEPDIPVTTGDQFLWRWYGWPDDVQEKGEIPARI